MKHLPAGLATCLGWILGSCAHMSLTTTGFLTDPESLERSPEREVAFIPDRLEWFEAEGVDWSGYRTLLIEPVEYVTGDGTRHPLPDEEARAYLTRKYRDHLVRELGQVFSVAEDARASSADGHTLRLRAAITDVDPEWVWLNVLGTILVVPPDMGGISTELELVDVESGERLLAMRAYREGTVFLFLEVFHRWGHAKHGMKKWSKLLRRELESRATPS